MVPYQVTRYLQLIGATRLQRDYANLVTSWQRVELVDANGEDAANLWAAQHRIGKPVDAADLLIATTALKAGATVRTNNTRHFNSPGVPLQNGTV